MGQLVGRLWAAELVCWFVGLLAGCLFVCLRVGLFVCWLVGWCVGRMVPSSGLQPQVTAPPLHSGWLVSSGSGSGSCCSGSGSGWLVRS